MAYHFSANQFEDSYQPKRLRNWEVPKWYPLHPRTPVSTTRFIANSRGHLLPGVPKTNPWGTYKHTWELPTKISKHYDELLPVVYSLKYDGYSYEEIVRYVLKGSQSPTTILSSFRKVTEVNAPPRKLQSLWGKRRAPPQALHQQARSDSEKLPVLKPAQEECFRRRNKSSTALDPKSSTLSKSEYLSPLPAPSSTPQIAPGTLNENVKRIIDENTEEKPEKESPTLCKDIETLQKPPDEAEVTVEEKKTDETSDDTMVFEKGKHGGPLMNDYSTFQVAKRFHDENLKHQPLPDVVDDPVFKALASNKDPFPGRALAIQPNASAIGWKVSGAPGPTKCSKVKVYRPKTGAMKINQKSKLDDRPKTCQTQKEKRFAPIDLAICWDLAPEDKPKRSLHIDGTDGGEAPSVFAMVRPEDKEINVAGSAQAVATHVLPSVDEDNIGTLPPKMGEKIEQPPRIVNKSAIMSKVKQVDSQVPSYHSLSPESAEIARQNPKTAWTNHDTSKELSERLAELQESCKNRKNSNSTTQSTPLSKQKHFRSTPNLASTSCQNKKQCEGSNCGTESTDEKGSKEEYKMAFKAGIPNIGPSPPPQQSKPLKMPKMRPPYAKKNYAISTLIPPFSIWPDHHGQEYPEHWRLASVYQHSYKPIDSRKKPLLASVFQ